MDRRHPHTEPDPPDPRSPARQVADVMALFCERIRVGTPPPSALREAVTTCSGPVAHELWDVLLGAERDPALLWETVAEEFRALAAQWRTPLLTTAADCLSQGADTLPVEYLAAVTTAAATGHTGRPTTLAERREQHPNHGVAWEPDEDALLRRGFTTDELSMAELAANHGRSTGAIRSRLVHLALIDPYTNQPAVFRPSATGTDEPHP